MLAGTMSNTGDSKVLRRLSPPSHFLFRFRSTFIQRQSMALQKKIPRSELRGILQRPAKF